MSKPSISIEEIRKRPCIANNVGVRLDLVTLKPAERDALCDIAEAARELMDCGRWIGSNSWWASVSAGDVVFQSAEEEVSVLRNALEGIET